MSVYTAAKSPFWQFDFRRSGHRFFGSFDGKDGRPRIGIDRPKREAHQAEALLKARAAQPATERARITLAEASTGYWEASGQYQADKSGEWAHIRNIQRIVGKHKYIDEIDDGDVSRMVATRRLENARYRDRPVANRTVNADVETLARIFKCVGKTKKYRMPADMPEWSEHKLKEPKERVRSLTTDEDVALFAAVDEIRPDYHDFIEFSLLSCKRLSEVYLLEKAKVDRQAMTARIIQKGGEEIVIALTPYTLAILERNWMHHPTRCFTYINQANKTYMNRGTMVSVRKGVRRPFTKNGWRKQWKAILKKAEITDFRFHDLRHTGLTRVLTATGNLKAVQDAASHASIASSARYAHTTSDQRRAALEAAERLRFPDKSRTADSKAEKKSSDATG